MMWRACFPFSMEICPIVDAPRHLLGNFREIKDFPQIALIPSYPWSPEDWLIWWPRVLNEPWSLTKELPICSGCFATCQDRLKVAQLNRPKSKIWTSWQLYCGTDNRTGAGAPWPSPSSMLMSCYFPVADVIGPDKGPTSDYPCSTWPLGLIGRSQQSCSRTNFAGSVAENSNLNLLLTDGSVLRTSTR